MKEKSKGSHETKKQGKSLKEKRAVLRRVKDLVQQPLVLGRRLLPCLRLGQEAGRPEGCGVFRDSLDVIVVDAQTGRLIETRPPGPPSTTKAGVDMMP